MVAQSLLTRSDGEELVRTHYWLRERKAQNAEIDFVVAHGPHVIPIEVKSGKTGRLRSLSEFCAMHSTEVALRCDTNLPSVQKEAFASKKVTKDIRNVTLVSLPLYLVTEMHRIVRSWIAENNHQIF